MLSDFVDCSVVDHQRRLRRDAQSCRAARSARGSVKARTAAVRADLGFRLVEAGLRLALGRAEPELRASRSVR